MLRPGAGFVQRSVNVSRPFSTSGSSRNQFVPSKIGIVGGAFGYGQVHQGVKNSPYAIRRNGIIPDLVAMGHDVKDFGNLQQEKLDNLSIKERYLQQSTKNQDEVGTFNEKLSDMVGQIKEEGRVVLTLGGDHSIALGSVHGILKHYEGTGQSPCVLWIDAHADINTTELSPSGNMHGMPLSFNVIEMSNENEDLKAFGWVTPRLKASDVAYIGLREVDPEEAKIIQDLDMQAFSMQDVDMLGIREVTKRAIRSINPNNDRPLHVSFDIDALDPTEAPATGTRVPGGLTLREGVSVLEECYRSGCLTALDLVEVNLDLVSEEFRRKKTLDAAHRLIMAAFGNNRGGNQPWPQSQFSPDKVKKPFLGKPKPQDSPRLDQEHIV